MTTAKRQNHARIAFLASGNGTTFEAAAEACQRNEILADAVLLITSRQGTPAEKRAQRLGIDVVVLDDKALGADVCDQKMADTLQSHKIDFVVLVGYLRKVGPRTLSAFANKVLNTHPGPLPRFGGKGMYGEHVHQAVLEAKIPFSAATIHMVASKYDDGPIIAARPVPVLADDDANSLGRRVQIVEKKLLVTTLAEVATSFSS